MRLTLNRRLLLSGSVILAALTTVTLIFTLQHGPDEQSAYHNKAATDTKSAQTKTSPSQNTTAQPTAATPKESNADKQVAANSNTGPITNACKLLTISTAKQVVGIDAHAVAGSSASSLQASGTTVTSCAFSGKNGTVQLIIRTPTDRLGASENSIQFGSGRPSSAVGVSGYGQSAYWNPANGTLNILSDNNWYIISRSTNSQADTEAATKLLSPGF